MSGVTMKIVIIEFQQELKWIWVSLILFQWITEFVKIHIIREKETKIRANFITKWQTK